MLTAERLFQLVDQYRNGDDPKKMQTMITLIHEGDRGDVATFAMHLNQAEISRWAMVVKQAERKFHCPKCKTRSYLPPSYPGDYFDCGTCNHTWKPD